MDLQNYSERYEKPVTFSTFCPPRKRSRASPNRDTLGFHFFFLRSHTGFGQPLSPRWALNVIGKRLICHLILILNIDGAYSNQRGGVLSSYTTHNCERRRRNVFHPAPLTIHNLRTASPVGHRRSTAGLDYDAHTRGTRTPSAAGLRGERPEWPREISSAIVVLL